VRVWDAVTGEELVRLAGHSDYVFALAFSPDAKTLVSRSGDQTVRLWDTATLKARYQARREAEALRPEAERLVERLFGTKNSAAAVAAALRGDRSLSEPIGPAAPRGATARHWFRVRATPQSSCLSVLLPHRLLTAGRTELCARRSDQRMALA
jgi:WD40 repeat protein